MLCIFFDLQPPHSTPNFALVEVISTCPWPCLYVFNGLRGCNMVKSIFEISTSPDRNVHRSTNVQERTGLRLREHYFVRYSDDHSNRCIGSSSVLFYCSGLLFLPCCQVASQFTILFFFFCWTTIVIETGIFHCRIVTGCVYKISPNNKRIEAVPK